MIELKAQFGCKLNNNGTPKDYNIVTGSTFTECFNEQLDSANIVLDHVSNEDRLDDIKPYDYVRVYETNPNNQPFDKLYLVDSFSEQLINVKDKIYSYNISLMSLTKLLEKIQLPNLTITHKNGNEIITIDNGNASNFVETHGAPYFYYHIDNLTIYTSLNYDIETYGLEHSQIVGVSNYVLDYIKTEKSSNDSRTILLSVKFHCDSQISTEGLEGLFFLYKLNVKLKHFVAVKKTIYQKISEYMKLYCPKIKAKNGDNWEYHRIIATPTQNSDFGRKFDVPCADMGLSAPTMRVALTSLMQQIGCIPKVEYKNGQIVLGYLDFNDIPTEKTIDDNAEEFNYISRGLSSDSYVNTLVDMTSNVLDNGGEVVCESLGFRDSNSAILKQEQNLYLETKFPIYKINKVVLKAPVQFSNAIVSSQSYKDNILCTYTYKYRSNDDLTNDASPMNTELAVFIGETGNKHFLYISSSRNALFQQQYDIIFDSNPKIVFGKFENPIYETEEETTLSGEQEITKIKCSSIINKNVIFNSSLSQLRSDTNSKEEITNMPSFENCDFACFTAEYHKSNDAKIKKIILYFNFNNSYKTSYGMNSGDFDYGYLAIGSKINTTIPERLYEYERSINKIIFGDEEKTVKDYLASCDMTALVKENQERSMLDNNFLRANNATTVEELSKYIYGTVGYSIGGNRISGFSDRYTYQSWQNNTLVETLRGWSNYEKTYFEHMYKVLKDNNGFAVDLYPLINDLWFDIGLNIGSDDFYNLDGSIELKWEQETLIDSLIKPITYTTCVFDVYYQPLNSFNLSFVKNEDIPFTISQYNSSSSGLTDFDRLSLSEQEQVNRFGQDVLSINQRTKDYNNIWPINSLYDGYTVFRKVVSINNFHYNISYTASKNAVLKNYFTSIRTKYRAYQYTDVSQSTLRKEKDVFYIRIGEGYNNYYKGDDRLLLGNSNLSYFIDGVKENSDNNSLTYLAETGSGANNKWETAKNDLSIVINDNCFAIIYEAPDNVGNGPYIIDSDLDYQRLGGFNQGWQIWGSDYEEYDTKHIVSYTNDSLVANHFNSEDNLLEAVQNENRLKYILRLPIIAQSTDEVQLFNPVSDASIMFSVVDDNSTDGDLKRSFYKDINERINHTVQFIYYTDSPNIKWTELWIQNNSLIQKTVGNIVPNCIVFSKSLTLDKESHEKDTSVDYQEDEALTSSRIQVRYNEGIARLRIYWFEAPDNYDVMKLCYKNGNKYQDFISFKRTNNEIIKYFSISLNDTRSDKVFTYTNGVLHQAGKVQTGTLTRSIDISGEN